MGYGKKSCKTRDDDFAIQKFGALGRQQNIGGSLVPWSAWLGVTRRTLDLSMLLYRWQLSTVRTNSRGLRACAVHGACPAGPDTYETSTGRDIVRCCDVHRHVDMDLFVNQVIVCPKAKLSDSVHARKAIAREATKDFHLNIDVAPPTPQYFTCAHFSFDIAVFHTCILFSVFALPLFKVMLMPEDKPEADIIMVATGTGIAPYRAFVRRLFTEKTPARENYKGQAWLFLGVANSDSLLYDAEWQTVLKENPTQFRLDYALSREQNNKDGGKLYIQDKVGRYCF